MGLVKVAAFSMSLDGFSAGPNQDLQNPLGVRGPEMFQWFFKTRAFHKMQNLPGGETGIDNDFAEKSFENVGANILGRNMFGPIRGEWPDDQWKGWWGPNPPYHTPVFVLTHHPRASIEMEGGTTFHFVTDGIESALKKAKAAAGNKDVRIGGGTATVRQYLKAGLIDEIHLVQSPVFLGQGENLFHGIDMHALGYTSIDKTASESATHFVIRKK